MKIFKTAPEQGDIYSHEGPTAKVLIGLTWFFVLISATTVTMAWNTYLQDFLGPMGRWRWVALITWGLIFVLPIEIMIFELSKYFWRSLIKGYHKGIHRGQFITATVLLVLGLAYSGYMSQRATKAAMVEAAPDIKTINTEQIDRDYRSQTRAAADTYNENADAVDGRYAALEKSTSRKHDAKIDALQKEYEILDARNNPANAKRLNSLSRQILAAEKAKADELANLATAKSGELSDLAAKKIEAEGSAAKLRETNLAILTEKGTGDNAAKSNFTRIFSNLIAFVAAAAVLFVFLLARFIELFYHRTGIRRVVIAENEDVSGSVLLDVIRFPFVAVSRHLATWIGRQYDRLPRPTPPRAPEIVYDANGMAAPVVAIPATSTPPLPKNAPANPPHVPNGVIPIAFSRTVDPPAKPAEMPSAKPAKEETTPPPAEKKDLAKTPEPVSLTSAKPLSRPAKLEAAKSAKGMPEELEDIIKAAFKNPVTDPANFYDAMKVWPAGYTNAFDYIEKLKKTARNACTAIHNKKAVEETKQANVMRLAYLEAELCRLSVAVIRVEELLQFRWILSQSERDGWKSKIAAFSR